MLVYDEHDFQDEWIHSNARVVELVDTQDLKSCEHCARAGSSPAPGTESRLFIAGFFLIT